MMFTKNKKVSTTFQRYSGFTLAEVLLTLMIVGIVATMTIPAVMHRIEKVSLHSAFLKAYSTAEQAHKVMMRENGGSVNGADFVINGTSYLRNKTFVVNAFNGQIRCGGTASHPATRDKCWHTKWNCAKPDNCSQTDWWGGFTTQDGMLWMYWYSADKNCTSTNRCFGLHVDVNGFKKPNAVGRDIFGIEFFADRILPSGAPGSYYAGYSCAGGSTVGFIGFPCAYYELTNKPKVGSLSGY